MEIPKSIRDKADKLYESDDNPAYIISVASGKYVPKVGNVFTIRHYHHIDRDRTNNELWNLAPLDYNEHIIEIHSKNNKIILSDIYDGMCKIFPEKEEFYRKYLLDIKGVA